MDIGTVALIVSALVGLGGLIHAVKSGAAMEQLRSNLNAYQSRQTSVQEDVAEIKRRLLEIEEARDRQTQVAASSARLVASLSLDPNPNGRGRSTRFCLANHGESTARKIQIFLDGVEWPQSVNTFGEAPKLLGPGSDFTQTLRVAINIPGPRHVRVEWQDDSSGDVRSWETELGGLG